MRKPYLHALFVVVAVAAITFADHKDREWKTGKVLDTESSSFRTYSGSTTQGQVNDDGTFRASTQQDSWNHKKYVFAIQGDGMIYVVSHVLSFRWSKTVQLTINGPVKYAVEKNKFYLIDENDREFKMKIEKKILVEK
jgi:hypothetical protein